MADIIYSHDLYFKKSMTDLRVARSFFKSNLPENLIEVTNFDSLKLCKDSLVDEQLKLSVTDMLYSAQIHNTPSYFYLLVEHQSSPDKWMALRVMRYVIRIMYKHVVDLKNKSLPIVYPMVFYNGKRRYPFSNDIFDLFSEKSLAKQLVFKPFHLIDLNDIDDESLREENWSSLMMHVMKHAFAREMMHGMEQMGKILISVMRQGGEDYMMSTLRYISATQSPGQKQVFANLLKRNLAAEEDNPMMTMAESWINEGMQKGMQQGVQKVAKNMLDKGMPAQQVADLTGLPMQQVRQLAT